MNSRILHQTLGIGEKNGVVGADKLMHLPSFSFQFRSARQFTPCRVHRPFLLSGAKNEQESGSLGVVIPLEESKNKLASIKPLVDLTRADMERVNQLIL
ncbi:polyprenyl synthetase family protein, partial [Rhizobium ruizarguesonis]